jgi:hypothetical protein
VTRIITDLGERNVLCTSDTLPADWKQAVLREGCRYHRPRIDICLGPLQAHHVITQQQLRKRGLIHLRWDVRNGMALCERAHSRHTTAVERIPYSLLSPENIAFAEENGLGWLLDRYYPRTEAA